LKHSFVDGYGAKNQQFLVQVLFFKWLLCCEVDGYSRQTCLDKIAYGINESVAKVITGAQAAL
jgi:hypothetical protein